MLPSVLVTKRIYPEAIEFLKQHAEVDYVDNDDGLPANELIERARGKQAIVSQLVDRFTPDVLARIDVKIIANVAVGFDNIDIPAATERGILVTNTPGVLTDTTADFAFTLLMAAARRVVEAAPVRALRAVESMGHGPAGRPGRASSHAGDFRHGTHRPGDGAPRARGFSMRILYHDTRRAWRPESSAN